MIVSDNGKTFKATSKELHSLTKHSEVQQFSSTLGIKWNFNLLKAPWWGGLFERLVKSTKRCLRKILGQSKLTYEELTTVLVEVEGVLNSRPLTYVSPNDIEEPLTPSHLLTGRRIMSLPDHLCRVEEEDSDSGHDVLTRRMRHLNRLLEQFWSRWRKEYLLELRESHRYHHGTDNPTPVSVGDVVVVHSTDHPRGFWKLGQVQEVLKGKDNKCRGAVVRVAHKGRQAHTLYRPIQLLYPLELKSENKDGNNSDEHDSQVGDSVDELSTNETESTPPSRPSRRAALEAKDRILAQTLVD